MTCYRFVLALSVCNTRKSCGEMNEPRKNQDERTMMNMCSALYVVYGDRQQGLARLFSWWVRPPATLPRLSFSLCCRLFAPYSHVFTHSSPTSKICTLLFTKNRNRKQKIKVANCCGIRTKPDMSSDRKRAVRPEKSLDFILLSLYSVHLYGSARSHVYSPSEKAILRDLPSKPPSELFLFTQYSITDCRHKERVFK